MKKIALCFALVLVMACEDDDTEEEDTVVYDDTDWDSEGKGGCRKGELNELSDACLARSKQSPGPWRGCDGRPFKVWTVGNHGNENGQDCTFYHSFPIDSLMQAVVIGQTSGPMPVTLTTAGNGDPVYNRFLANLECDTQEQIDIWDNCGSHIVFVGTIYDSCGEPGSDPDATEI